MPQTTLSLIPRPVHVREMAGAFTLTPKTRIDAPPSVGRLLQGYLSPATGFELPVGRGGEIVLRLDKSLAPLGAEGYRLTVTPRRVEVRAFATAGLLWGMQTLRQLLPASIYRQAPVDATWTVPCVEIEDMPRFGWRGLMLDLGRRFLSKQDLLRYIEWMALHKLNVFHMHLSEDAGWRMEIKRYPKLTTIGAFRKGTQLNREGRNDGRPHGGFYTQDDLREIIAFAGTRGVHILPEIDMPGHSTAAIVAYPELGTSGAATEVPRMWGSPDVLNMEPRTVQFAKDVLTEVADLFPFAFVHVGGDEARWELWKASKLVQARREALGLKDEAALQAWFTRQLDAHLTSKKKRLVGWDEILEGGLAPGATVMAWRGTAGGIKAAKMGHDVVMAPTSHTYFDYYQSQDTASEPPAIGGFLPLRRVYDFEPVPAELTPTEAKHILGAQGQIWGEYLPDNRHAEYLTFPRACALAEVTWSPREGKDYEAFLRRLHLHRARLDALGIQYRPLEER